MFNRSRLFSAAIASLALFVVAPAAAASPAIEAAKSQCVIGEQADGYLGFAEDGAATEELRREVRSVNQQRRAVYERLAERNGVTVEVTAALTAERLMNQAPSGQCVRDQSGSWIRK